MGKEDCERSAKRWVTVIVFLIYFIENVLLTVVVPVVPDYLEDAVEASGQRVDGDDFGAIGALFAAKSLAQLLANPLVAACTRRFRPEHLIFAGNAIFFSSAVLFAAGQSYGAFFVARAVHGLGSAAAIIPGLALLSETFREDGERSRAMGFSLGGMAVGVLVGYPAGGFLYTYCGKAAPFLLAAGASLCLGVLLVFLMPLSSPPSSSSSTLAAHAAVDAAPPKAQASKSMAELLRKPTVAICIGSIGVSTAAIATLEPCLPLWLRQGIRPEEWQIGTAFLPDSVGYLIGTNAFGVLAPRLGRWLCALLSHAAVCVSAFAVPSATAMPHLILPHFGIGLGIATIDASLMPLLARAAEGGGGSEGTEAGSFGAVFALYQTTVCLAYGLGPFLGGWLMAAIGFPALMRLISLMNLCFVPLVYRLRRLEVERAFEEAQAKARLASPHETYGAIAAQEPTLISHAQPDHLAL